MSSSSSSNVWNDGLKLISYCPTCDTRYNPMQARMLGEDGETHLMHVTCKKCQNSILSVVLTSQTGASSVGLITDLSFEDVMGFATAPRVSVDDVIETHEFFESDAWKVLYKPKKIAARRKTVRKTKASSAKKSK